MDIIKGIFRTFVYIMTGSTISTTIFITLFYPQDTFQISLLWEIIVLSLVGALGNFIYYYKSALTKKQIRVRIILHYLYIIMVVFGGGILWGWLDWSLLEFAVMFLLVSIVYASIMLVLFRQDRKLAENINRQLRKRFRADEEGED